MKRYCIIVLMLACATRVTAQNAESLLYEKGFENVEVAFAGDTMFVELEDPRYRGTFRGMGESLKLLAAADEGCTHFELVAKEYMVPKVAVHASCEKGVWAVNVDYDTQTIINRIKNVGSSQKSRGTVGVKKSTNSIGKVDLTFYPTVSVVNNRLDVICLYGIFLAPALETTLWWGNRVTVQPIIPLVNNYDDGSLKKRFQLGVVSVQQDIVNDGRFWARVAAGTFSTYRLGVSLNAGVKLNKNLSLSVVANWSAASANMEDGWYVGRKYGRYLHAKADWFEPKTGLQVQMSAGQFLYGDRGARMDVSRHFGEYVVGVYGVYTKAEDQGWMHGEHNAGFHFAIPFGGKSQHRRGYFRVKLPEYYGMEYSMVSYYRYADDVMGESLVERPDENRAAHYWQAEYIRLNLLKMLNEGCE